MSIGLYPQTLAYLSGITLTSKYGAGDQRMLK